MKSLSEFPLRSKQLSQRPLSAMKDLIITVQYVGNSAVSELIRDMNDLGEPSSDPGIDPGGTRQTSMINAEVKGDSIHNSIDQFHSTLNHAKP